MTNMRTFAIAGLLCAALPALGQADPASDFNASDADADGALTKAEFKTFIDRRADAGGMRASMVRSRNMYDRAFGKVDKNGDGSVTKEEIRN